MIKTIQKIFIVAFFLFCAMPVLALTIGYRNENVEKRILAKWPALIEEGRLNTKYPSDIEEYLADHYAFRPLMVTADAKLKASLFGESTSDQVIIGKEDWLFFRSTLDDYQRVIKLSDNDLYRISRILELQDEYLSQQGVRLVFMVAPNKASIYPEYMPERFVRLDSKSDYERLCEYLSDSGLDIIDLHESLRGQSAQVYHKLDTHWNNLGATVALGKMIEEIQIVDPSLHFVDYEEQPPVIEMTHRGDLSNMLYPSMDIMDEQVVFDLAGDYRTRRPMRSLEDLLIQTDNDNGQNVDVLMFRDSFANALIPFLSESLRTITYSRTVPYDYGLMTDETDIVFIEIVERNLEVLLQGTPQMPVYEVNMDFDISSDYVEVDATITPSKEGVFIYGVAVPESVGTTDTNYEIYLRLISDDNVITVVTFPVLEGSYVESAKNHSNAAFAARISFDSLPAGIYSASVVVCGPENYAGDLPGIQFEVPQTNSDG